MPLKYVMLLAEKVFLFKKKKKVWNIFLLTILMEWQASMPPHINFSLQLQQGLWWLTSQL